MTPRLYRIHRTSVNGTLGITIPEEVLKALGGAKAGDYVYWRIENGVVQLRKPEIR